MNELERARKQIDAIDAQAAALFAQRMEAVAAVASYKAEKGLPVFDAAREEAVIRRGANLRPRAALLLCSVFEAADGNCKKI